MSIPVGTLTGSALLAGRGPRITVRMESVGSSAARFENAFTSAGINQTQHQIILTWMWPSVSCCRDFTTAARVSNSVIVAETDHRGDSVPSTYTSFQYPA